MLIKIMQIGLGAVLVHFAGVVTGFVPKLTSLARPACLELCKLGRRIHC